MKEIVNLKAQLVNELTMKDLGPTRKIFGMRINREEEDC